MSNKYCKDCKHCQYVNSAGYIVPGDYSLCRNPINKQESLVTGKYEMRSVYCDKMRREGEACGPNAVLFEPNEAYAEYLRDQAIEAAEERSRDRAEERQDFDFERDCGARP